MENSRQIDLGYDPLPRQLEFHQSKSPFRLYSGAIGAGKTLALVIEAVRLMFAYPGSVGVLGRWQYSDLKRTTMMSLFEVLSKLPPVLWEHHKGDQYVEIKVPGAKPSICYLLRMDSVGTFQSLNLDWFGVDEATEVPADVWDMLENRMRRGTIGRLCGFGATNPDAKTHHLYQKFWESGDSDYQVFETTSLENQYLPGFYKAKLQKMEIDEDFYGRFVMGRWGAFKGLVYKGFNANNHIVQNRTPARDSTFYAGIDFGFHNPFCFLLIEHTKDDEFYALREHYARGLRLSEHVEAINAILDEIRAEYRAAHEYDFRVSGTFYDPSAAQEAYELQGMGIDAEPADNTVQGGIIRIKELLADNRLKVCQGCPNLAKEFGAYKHRVKGGIVTDEIVKENDHALDVLRYIINSVGVVGAIEGSLTVQRRN